MKLLLLMLLLAFACAAAMALMARLSRITAQLGELKREMNANQDELQRRVKIANAQAGAKAEIENQKNKSGEN